MKYDEQQRKEIRRMLEQGMSESTVYRRMADRYPKENKEPTFDYEANTPKGEFV